VVIRRTAIALVTLLALAIHGTPALAQDFDFGGVFRVRGMTTHLAPSGQGGSLSGTLNLNSSGALLGGSLTRNPGSTTTYTEGGLGAANRTVTGVLDTGVSGEELIMIGSVLNPDVLVFTTTAGIITPPAGRPLIADAEMGMAFAVRQTGTYSGTDLRNSTWRIKAMATPVLPPVYSDEGGWAFGSISLSDTRTVTGGSLVYADGHSDVIYPGGTFNINATGTVTGSFSSGSVEQDDIVINGIMSPDKSMIVAIFRLGDEVYPNLSHGLAILEREPAVAFSTSDLGGSWDYVGLDQNEEPNGNVGRWIIGHFPIDSAGEISGAVLTSPLFTGTASGLLGISSDGFICSGGPACDSFITVTDPENSVLSVHAIMSADKNAIFGVYNRFTSDESERRGLFTLVRRPSTAASTVQFGAATYTKGEGAGATSITVVRTGALTNSATVRYTITGGSATRGSDYTAPITRVLTFDPGVDTVSIPLTILQDTIEEARETIRFALSDPTAGMTLGGRSTTVVRITDDDPAGALAFAATQFTATEGGPAAVITVVRTGGTASGVTVQFATSNGTATAGSDYQARSGTLSFGAGQTSRTFTVPILDDSRAESAETVTLTLSNPGGGGVLGSPSTAVLRILDNEPIIGFTGRWVGDGLEVERTGPANVTSRVDYGAIDGTAIAGSDYAPLSGTLTFGPGVRIRIIPIRVLRDTAAEGNEHFTVVLSNAVRARLGQTRRQVVIKDNDFGGTVQFNAATYSVNEGANRTITVTRTGGAGTELAVHVFTSDGTASAGSNYIAVSRTLLFAVGQTSRTFTVRTLLDECSCTNRTINLHVRVPEGAAELGPRHNAVLTIVNAPGEVLATSTRTPR
jgi:hypothetical protein